MYRSTKVKALVSLAAGVILAAAAGAQAVQPSAGASSSAPAAAGSPSQTASTSSRSVVTLDNVVAAGRATALGLKLASVAADTARAQRTQVQASNGLSLGGKADYLHVGSLLGASSSSTAAAAAATGAGGQALSGDNVQGGLTLSGPATSVGLGVQHSIDQATSGDQVSSVNVSASQTVFDGYPGGRAAATVAQADYTFRAAQVTYDASVKSVIFQVRQAYYTLLNDQNTLLIRQAAVAQAEQNLSYYQGLLRVQRATDLDVLQNQVTLTQAQLDLASAQNTAEVDRKTLSSIVDWPLDKDYVVADSPFPEPPTSQLNEALQTAFQNRSELRILALNIAAADINLKLQQSQAYPVVSINGSVGVGQDWTANVNTGSFTVGASIALPVVDGGLRSAQVQQAMDQLSSYKVQQDQQTQSITIAVQNALFGVRDAKNRLDLAGQNVKAGQGQYDLEKARYAVGLVTTLDVLTSFSALTTAQVGLQQARSTYVLAVLNLNNLMGL